MNGTGDKKRILVIGDILLDHFIYGRVERLNPESPNPLLTVTHDSYALGGAANVAANIVSLGGAATLIGIIGRDAAAEKVEELCAKNGVELRCIKRDAPTILKERCIETTYRQQLLRMDREERLPLSSTQTDELNGLISQASPDMVVFSDYAKGCLNQSVIQCAMQYAPALVDTKPGTASLFSGATIIKPNFKEFLQMCGIQAPNTNETIGLHGPQLARKLQTNLVVTRSEMGASFVDLQGKVKHIPSLAQDIFDVTGAGDTFMAALAVGISEGMSEWHAVDFGNRASAVAVSHIGTAVVKRLDVPNPTIPEFFE